MSTELLIFLAIVVLGIVLVAVGLVLARRSRGEVPGEGRRPAPPPPAPPRTPEPPVGPTDVRAPPAPEAPAPLAPPAAPVRPRLRDRLGRTRAALADALGGLRGRRVDAATWDELEEALLLADVGLATTQRLLREVRMHASAGGVTDADGVVELLRARLIEEMGTRDRELRIVDGEPNVWLFVGVNGVGKTTTIAKLAQREVRSGRRVLLAAADTFRAAAAEQLQMWGDRVGARVVRGQEGADPGSVVFDAMNAAQSRQVDLVLVDTAGRLHTKTNLMEELKKLRRIIERTPGSLREVLLVVDASTGQNGLVQARQFADAVDVTGIVLTKLDGTAKGGIAIAVQHELDLPVKLVGVGESAEDLVEFDPTEFIDALFT